MPDIDDSRVDMPPEDLDEEFDGDVYAYMDLKADLEDAHKRVESLRAQLRSRDARDADRLKKLAKARDQRDWLMDLVQKMAENGCPLCHSDPHNEDCDVGTALMGVWHRGRYVREKGPRSWRQNLKS